MIFLLARRVIRDFRAVVGIDGIDVFDGRPALMVCGVIIAEFVSIKPAGFTALAFNQVAKEADHCVFVPSALKQNIKIIPILINRTPQILLFPLNGDDRFI